MGELKLTTHAAQMMEERGIRPEWVAATVNYPANTMADPHDPALTRSFRAIPEADGRVLRVVHRPADDDIVVVTAHFDRGARI